MIRRHSRRRRHAFTLMEILLVLAILVVLAAMVAGGYNQLQKNAYKDTARSQIKLLEDCIGYYSLAIGTPPTTEQGLGALVAAPSDLKNPAKWQGPYINKALPKDPWGNDYQYEQLDASLGTFRIWSSGPDGQSGTEDDVSTDQPQT